MRYIVRKSIVNVIGPIWQPGFTCAQTYSLSSYDVENARDESGNLTRDSIDQWLATHAGDFREITDFEASIEDGDRTVTIPWADEESEITFNDCMFGHED